MTRRALVLATCLFLGYAASLSAQTTPRAGGARSGAAPAAASVLGKWDFTVNSPDGVQNMMITFERIDGALLGSGQGQFGAFTVVEVMQAGSDLAFTMRFDSNGQVFDIPFNGKISGAAAEGSLTFSMGGGSPQTIPWTAKKVP